MTTYNGWTNYETWRINLEMWDGYEIEHGDFDDVESLADYLKGASEEIIMSQSEGIAQDYAMAFLSEVNWHEIAKHKADEKVDNLIMYSYIGGVWGIPTNK